MVFQYTIFLHTLHYTVLIVFRSVFSKKKTIFHLSLKSTKSRRITLGKDPFHTKSNFFISKVGYLIDKQRQDLFLNKENK